MEVPTIYKANNFQAYHILGDAHFSHQTPTLWCSFRAVSPSVSPIPEDFESSPLRADKGHAYTDDELTDLEFSDKCFVWGQGHTRNRFCL